MNLHCPEKLGYWLADGIKFPSKVLAATHASLHQTDYHFVFNDDELDRCNWLHEPERSIDGLYRQRALQLREKYDHIIIFFSGGADSTTVLQSFLQNNIHVDEVISWGAWNHKIDQKSHRLNCELFQAGSGLIQQCIDRGSKFTHINYLDMMHEVFRLDNWTELSDWRMTPESEFRRRLFYHRPQTTRILDRGRSVALIFGRDKSRIIYHDGYLCFSALDMGMGQDLYPEIFADDFAGPCTEWFFSTPDLPEIMIKQAHLIVQWYQTRFSDQDLSLLLHPWSHFFDPMYNERINPLIYPSTWRNDIFSVGKGSPGSFAPKYHKSSWFWHSLNDTVQYKVWEKGIEDVFDLLSPRVLVNGNLDGRFARKHKIKNLHS